MQRNWRTQDKVVPANMLIEQEFVTRLEHLARIAEKEAHDARLRATVAAENFKQKVEGTPRYRQITRVRKFAHVSTAVKSSTSGGKTRSKYPTSADSIVW